MWLLLFIIFVAVSCPSSYLSIKPFNQPSFFPSFFPSFLPFAFITPTGFLSIVLFTTFDTAIFRWCYSTLVFKGFLSINQWPGALSVQPKLSKIWKQRQMVQKLFRNCWISKMWNIQRKVESWIKRKNVGIPPFATARKSPKIQTGRFGWMENAQGKLEGPFAGRTNRTFQLHLCEKKWTKFRKVLCV